MKRRWRRGAECRVTVGKVSAIPIEKEERTMRLRFMMVPKESLQVTFSLDYRKELPNSL